MPYVIDHCDDGVRTWTLTDEGATVDLDTDYTPTLYVASDAGFGPVRELLDYDPTVVGVGLERRRRGFRHDPEPVLRVDVTGVDRVRPVARRIAAEGAPGEFRLFDVDLSPGFRYCLDRDCSPVPAREPTTLALSAPRAELADQPLATVRIGDGDGDTGGRTVDCGPTAVVEAVDAAVRGRDPDVLVLSSADLVAALADTARACGRQLHLGRRPGYRRLAGESTYESYGRVGHSPARYSVPGRAIVDRSNTFLYGETNLAGCLDLVERSRRPLQELAWASIGTVLTAIQVREARERGVLVPWRSWRHELFKSAATLHDADRGGVTFAPDVGVHEDVHELDFASLYPSIIRTRNVSPETVRCECHRERADVPGLGYAVCDRRGYLPDVLGPLIDDRAAIKAELEGTDDPDLRAALQGRADALKWILVSCFGYQGFANAKFGRIECHEAINAFAREILLDAKQRLEDGGWRVVHGIVDSLWVTARDDEPAALERLCAAVSDEAGIDLEYEAAFDWIAVVPRRDSAAGALTRYFGRRADGSFKYRGIECRQRSTPAYVADCQRALVETFDRHRSPEAVCDRLRRQLRRLRAGDVDPSELAITSRTSKRVEEYACATRQVAALRRARDRGLDPSPGQDVAYVVVDDDRDSRERVALASEKPREYDREFYADRLVRAAESVLSPVGWREEAIRRYLADTVETSLAAFAADWQDRPDGR